MRKMVQLNFPPSNEVMHIRLPKDSIIRHVAVRAEQMPISQASGLVIPAGLPKEVNTVVKESLVMWIEAILDDENPESTATEDRSFIVIGTDRPFPPSAKLTYHGTLFVHGGALPVHLYEVVGIIQ
jgi:hypothetical protein